MNHERLVVPIEWKADSGDANTLEGYASVFDVIDAHGDIVKKGAFAKTIGERLAAGKVKFLDSHVPDAAHVLGTVVEAKETRKGLYIKVKLSNAPSVQDMKIKMQEGHIDRMSIGYTPVKWAYAKSEDGAPIRELTEVKLFEVSAVAFPANEHAAITSVKSALAAGAHVLDELEHDKGHSPALAEAVSALNDAVKALGTIIGEPVGTDGDGPAHNDTSGDGPDEGKSTGPDSSPDGEDASPDDEADAPDPQHDAPDDEADDAPKGDRHLKELMRKGRALLDGRDPDEVADPAQVAGITARLDLLSKALPMDAITDEQD